MEYFIDTNMSIGYSFSCDKWHKLTFDFISDHKNNINWSDNVETEFNTKFREIFEEINRFINALPKLIKEDSEDFLNVYSFEKYVLGKTHNCTLDIFKKSKIIEYFWNNYVYNSNTSNSDLKIKLEMFISTYLIEYDILKKQLESIVKPYNCGTNNYLNYPKLINKLFNELNYLEV